jgi:hypothetical protein
MLLKELIAFFALSVVIIYGLCPLILAYMLDEKLHMLQSLLKLFEIAAGLLIRACQVSSLCFEVSISQKVILCQIVQGSRCLLEVIYLCPMLIAFTLLSLETVLNVDDKAYALAALTGCNAT